MCLEAATLLSQLKGRGQRLVPRRWFQPRWSVRSLQGLTGWAVTKLFLRIGNRAWATAKWKNEDCIYFSINFFLMEKERHLEEGTKLSLSAWKNGQGMRQACVLPGCLRFHSCPTELFLTGNTGEARFNLTQLPGERGTLERQKQKFCGPSKAEAERKREHHREKGQTRAGVEDAFRNKRFSTTQVGNKVPSCQKAPAT